MNEELIAAKCIKAAAAGYAQQLGMHNFLPQVVAACTQYYTDGENGTLIKRAAKKQACVNIIANALAQAYGVA